MSDTDCNNCNTPLELCECGDAEGYCDDGAVCPYCGHKEFSYENEGYLCDETNNSNECTNCGKEYIVDLYVSYTWTTSRKVTNDE